MEVVVVTMCLILRATMPLQLLLVFFIVVAVSADVVVIYCKCIGGFIQQILFFTSHTYWSTKAHKSCIIVCGHMLTVGKCQRTIIWMAMYVQKIK